MPTAKLDELSANTVPDGEAGRTRSIIQNREPQNGGVAQLGEHLPCKQGVMGSNPIISTRRQIAAAKRRKKQGEGSRETRYTEDDYMGS